jgi:hypothetical protein
MKVCYLIQTYKKPAQIYRLIRTIKKLSPDSQVIVSHDFSNCNLELTALKDLSGVQVFPGKGGRGDFATVQRYLDAVDWLLNNNVDFDWLINITGQDYPVQPLSKSESFLAETSYDGFIEYFKVFSQESHWSIREGYSRYLYRYKQLILDLPEWQKELLNPLKVINYIQPFFRINFSYGLIVGVRAAAPFKENFICYGGAFYCTLSRKCVQYLHEFSKENPEVVEYYRNVGIPEESFLQSVLVNSRLFNLGNDCKRYFDFSKTRNGRPSILKTDDYQAIIQSDSHFARKFDIDEDSKILDLLDSRMLPNYQESRREANSL